MSSKEILAKFGFTLESDKYHFIIYRILNSQASDMLELFPQTMKKIWSFEGKLRPL